MLSDPTLRRITSTGSYPPADECMRYILFVMGRNLNSVGHMSDDDERVFNLKRIWPTYELPRIHLGGQYKIFGDGFARDLITLDPKIRTFIQKLTYNTSPVQCLEDAYEYGFEEGAALVVLLTEESDFIDVQVCVSVCLHVHTTRI